MSTYIVNILTPNGRRQNIKMQPNTILLHALEEVCKKHNYPVDSYDLVHHKKILDLSLSFRFSGLPNNAQLEMTESKMKKTSMDDCKVLLCIQFENGIRLTESFHPAATLMDILIKLCPEKITEFNPDTDNNVLVFMRNEIYGNALKTTTLKSLGIIGGNSIIRHLHRNPDKLKQQANISVPLKSTVRPEELDKPNLPSTSKILKRDTNEIMDIDIESSDTKIDTDNNKKCIVDECPVNTVESKPVENLIVDSIVDESQIEVEPPLILGEKDAILFPISASTLTLNIHDNIPDDFFELTVDDLKILLKQLREKINGNDDAPMLTTQMRQLEENKQILNKLARYSKSIIRIQFPERLILQGSFTHIDTIENVMEFIKTYLIDPNLNFHLFTTPPKQILPKELTLVELNLIPTALIHFGFDVTSTTIVECKKLFKDELYSKLSTIDAAIFLASKSRGLPTDQQNITRNSLSTTASRKQTTLALPSTSNYTPSQSSFNTSGNKPTTENIPKWFKQSGK